MSKNRLSKPLVFFLALLISMFALGSSSALAEEASIKSLVESGDIYSDMQEESSQAALASENSDKEAPADYNTVTTEDGSVLKWKKDGTKNAKIVGYVSLTPNLIVPSSIEGLSVIGLADMVVNGAIIPNSTFSGAKELETVTLPDTMWVLSGGDFSDCVNLKRIQLGSGLSYIGMSTFSNCSSLESIDIPDSCKKIESVAFMSCSSLKSVHLPAGITQLGSGTFADCPTLTAIEIPAGLTSIGGGCFEGSGLKSISLPKGLKTVANTAFRSCPLEWAYVPSSVTKIGDSAFDPSVLIIADSGDSEARYWARRNSNTYIAGTLDDYYQTGYTIPSFDYTGYEQKPEVALRNSNYDHFPMEYAKVAYKNNINAGTATCTVTSDVVKGKQEYSFTIRKVPIYRATISPIETQLYSGQVIKPKVEATLGDYPLIEGVDFTCSYDTSSSYSSYGRVTITGKGNFESSTDEYFDIKRAPVTIRFETNGGTAVPSYTAEYGNTHGIWQYIRDNEPSYGGRRFLGWYKDPELKQRWDSYNDAPIGDTTLYASWSSAVRVSRFDGFNRYDTSAMMVERYGEFDTLVLVSGENYPDALSASALAGALNAPIKSTNSSYLCGAAESIIKRHQPKEIILVGGPAAISDYTLDEVRSVAPKATITRIWGNTRYETAVNVCDEISKRKLSTSTTGVIASGQGFADALSVAPYSASDHVPILLSGPSGLSKETIDTIKSAGFSRMVIVGGYAAVPKTVEDQLRSCGIKDIVRLAGQTRYETSAKVADFIVGSNEISKIYCAAGSNFPDALSAGPLAAQSGSPILLVDKSSTAAEDWLAKKKGIVFDLYVAGGSSAVPDSLVERLKSAAQE